MKIRGTANHIYDKYQTLARDASSSGDRVAAENYLQHAEHYYRILSANAANQANQGQAAANAAPHSTPNEINSNGRGNGQQPAAPVDEARMITPDESGPTIFPPIDAKQAEGKSAEPKVVGEAGPVAAEPVKDPSSGQSAEPKQPATKRKADNKASPNAENDAAAEPSGEPAEA